MKIKYFTTLIVVLIGSMAQFTSCADDIEIGKPIDESAYNGVYENNAYLCDGKSNRTSVVIELYKNTYTASVKMGLSKLPGSATLAVVKYDAEYIKVYNQEHETDFELYPQDLVSFDNEGMLSIKEDSKFSEVKMTVRGGSELEEGKTYVIPVAIGKQSDDFTVKNEKARHCVYLVKDMRNLGDTDKGEDLPKGFLIFEVNDANPLNALSYKLENGKLLWDVVVLFSANINYDAEAGRPGIKCNSNVQYLLDNNEAFLQPLRRRGIKVLLGVLGNWDMTGVAQLSKQGAKDFAREITQYCKAYKLDGVFFDDEYSDDPDLSNPALDEHGMPAGARLCYETKRLMPDKLVTVYIYDGMYGEPSVDGTDVDEWVDIAVPDYNGTAEPVGNMTRKMCAGAALQFNLGLGGNITDYKAQQITEGGYGWFMGFGATAGRLPRILERLTGVRNFYASPLAPPSIYYKKNDPAPYLFSEFDGE